MTYNQRCRGMKEKKKKYQKRNEEKIQLGISIKKKDGISWKIPKDEEGNEGKVRCIGRKKKMEKDVAIDV